MSMDESESVGLSLDTSQLNGDCSEFLANDDSQGTFSDTVDSMDEASSSHSSVVADDNGELILSHPSFRHGTYSYFVRNNSSNIPVTSC
ncbi:hypothetical protein Leryth_004424, partial [Lithospermum erythrorhizon]